jgi:hypothetical protein
MPETATAEVTLRRLQRFEVRPGVSYSWKLVRDGQPVDSGRITPNAANVLTIPNVTLSTVPTELLVGADR